MRLSFRILWIEDQPQNIKGMIESIKDHIQTLGFKFEPIFKHSLSEATAAVGVDTHSDNIDLVFVDCELGTEKHGGTEVLKAIRREMPYKEVLFYSAKYASELRQHAHESQIEGVYFCNRDDLVEKGRQLITSILFRVLDLDNIRGIVMAATSDIDSLVADILLEYEIVGTRIKGQQLQETLRVKLEEQLKKWTKELAAAVTDEGGLDSLLKLHAICGSDIKLRQLVNILKEINGKDDPILSNVTTYRDEIIPQRNNLAHVRITPDQSTPDAFKEGGEFSPERMKKLRMELIYYLNVFETFLKALREEARPEAAASPTT